MRAIFLLILCACSLSSYELRPATNRDLDIVYDLIYELAIFEGKDPAALPVTKENLQRFGFGEWAYFHTELAELDGKVVGYALYSYPFCGHQGKPFLYIDDLYVKPEYRGQGIGTALLKKLACTAEEVGCCRMEWHVFDWNGDAMEFYQKIGGKLRKDLLAIRLERDAMLRLGYD